MKVKSESEAAQSCPTLSDPMNCSLPGSSIHGIFQARVLEWGAIAFSISHFSHIQLCISGYGNPLQYSCLENPRDKGAWWAAIYGVIQSRTRLKRLSSSSSSGFLEKAMASHSSTLAWKIPQTEEPGRLQSMGSHRVRHG